MSSFRRLSAAALALAITAFPVVTAAQDPFEIQVYEYQTVAPGRWDLETHLNHVARGVKTFEGSVAPSDGQTHLTFELTRGITEYFEVAGYLVTARRNDGGSDLAGWRLRPRFRLPESWLPFKFSLSTEFGFPRDTYEEADITFELRPILERSFGQFQVDLNPTMGKALRGPGAAEQWDFEPGVRLGYTTSRTLDLSLEYYGSTGPIDRAVPSRDQVHQFFPGADINFNDNVVLNVGVGFGATNAGNTLVYKTRLGWIF